MLSKELLNHSEVQRILCDMGTRLEGFMNIYSKQNPQFKDFVLKGSLSTYMDKPSPTSHFKKISYKCGTTTPNLTETRNVFTPVARHQSISETRTGLKSAAQQTRPSVSPQKG